MRLVTLALTAALVLTSAPLVLAPTAEAACDPNVPGTCVKCVYGYPGQGCIVTNPCDPRYCDPWP